MIFVLFGALSGFVNGFFGTGGGIAVVIATYIYYKNERKETDFIKKQLATANAVVFLLSISSLAFLSFKEVITKDEYIFMLQNLFFGAIIGSIVGVFLLKYIKGTVLKKLFAVLIAYSGIRMIIG